MPDQPDTMLNQMNERTRAARERAQHAARTLLEQAGLDHVADSATERVTRVLEDVLAASRTNRHLLEKMVGDEIDKAAARWGFARQSEVDALRREVADLRSLVAATPARKAAVRKASARKAPSKTGAAKTGTTKSGTSRSGTTKTGASRPADAR